MYTYSVCLQFPFMFKIFFKQYQYFFKTSKICWEPFGIVCCIVYLFAKSSALESKSRYNPKLWALAGTGQCGVSCGILIGMLYCTLLSGHQGSLAVVTSHCSCPLCVIFLVTASLCSDAGPRSPAGWKLCWFVPTYDPSQPIRGQVTEVWTNDSSADSLRCDAGYYVWCLGVSQTRHKSYRSHNKEDGIHIFCDFSLLNFRPVTIFCFVNIYSSLKLKI